jgi:hypothetical protein
MKILLNNELYDDTEIIFNQIESILTELEQFVIDDSDL